MLKCPKCNAAFNQFVFRGWVVNAEGSAQVDEDGEVAQVGALMTRCSVKPGKEFAGKHVEIFCPECGHSGPYDSFPSFYRCFISGAVSDTHVSHKVLGKLFYAKEHGEIMAAIVAEDGIDWACDSITQSVMYNVTNGLMKRKG